MQAVQAAHSTSDPARAPRSPPSSTRAAPTTWGRDDRGLRPGVRPSYLRCISRVHVTDAFLMRSTKLLQESRDVNNHDLPRCATPPCARTVALGSRRACRVREHLPERRHHLRHVGSEVATDAKVAPNATWRVRLLGEAPVLDVVHPGDAHVVEPRMRCLHAHARREQLEESAPPLAIGR